MELQLGCPSHLAVAMEITLVCIVTLETTVLKHIVYNLTEYMF